LVKKFETYFYFGGFAETFPLKDKRSWLNSLFQKILLGDVISRNDIRNESSIRLIVKKLAESIMQPLALARILGVIKSAGCSLSYNTLVDYLQYLNDAYLIFGISNFSDKLSEKESIKKRYFFDNGLLNTFIIEPESKLLENLVAIELKKRYQEGVFYYKKNVEVDFYIPSMHSAIQVSLSLSQSDTREREVRALIKMSQAYPLKKLQIITWEEEDVVEEADLHIEVLPLWKWLLI
jgi:predicted AAA+ superfamily ATPase